jgi:hypothetical protein
VVAVWVEAALPGLLGRARRPLGDQGGAHAGRRHVCGPVIGVRHGLCTRGAQSAGQGDGNGRRQDCEQRPARQAARHRALLLRGVAAIHSLGPASRVRIATHRTAAVRAAAAVALRRVAREWLAAFPDVRSRGRGDPSFLGLNAAATWASVPGCRRSRSEPPLRWRFTSRPARTAGASQREASRVIERTAMQGGSGTLATRGCATVDGGP